MSVSQRSIAAATAVLAFLAAAPATAQSGNLDIQTFRPVAGPDGIVATEASTTAGPMKPVFNLMLDYSSRPLVEVVDGDEVFPIVDQQLSLRALAGLGLGESFQVDLHFPYYVVNEGQIQGTEFLGAEVGDLDLRAKYDILGRDGEGVGLAVAAGLAFPTGNPDHFVGTPGLSEHVFLIADWEGGPLTIAANVGAKFRESATFARNLDLGPAATFGLGAEYSVLDGLLLLDADVWGSSSFGDFFAPEDTPIEGLLGAKIVTTQGIAIMAAAGGGLAGGAGAPEARSIFGVSYAERDDDFDDDGLKNSDDECPEEAEDPDGFEDQDGCPEADNDLDGIPDSDDACALEPEDMDGFEDQDGCAEPDNDRDEIADADDQCRDDAEDVDGFQDEDGCPDLDNDEDGIPDSGDRCPERAEDLDQFEDEDGCPEADNDYDGIEDVDDACPLQAGIPELKGCPPAETKAVREKEAIKILDKVFFETKSAVILEESFDLLNQVALILRTNPDVKLVEIGGHTDDRGKDADNLALSEERAKSVREYLIRRGIAPERLEAKGYGEGQPLDPKRNADARAKNRRVEFKIVAQEGVEKTEPKADDGAEPTSPSVEQ